MIAVMVRAVAASLFVSGTGAISGGVRFVPALVCGALAGCVTLVRTVSGLNPVGPPPVPKPVTLLEHTENDYLAGRLTFEQFEQRASDLIESGQEDKVLPPDVSPSSPFPSPQMETRLS